MEYRKKEFLTEKTAIDSSTVHAVNRAECYSSLKEEILSCRACQAAFGFEPRPIVFGNVDAKIMQISQAPSKTVHETGKPFHDASGKRLRSEWYQISDEDFYNPDHFYIVSIAHCYPGKAPKGGDRRPPKSCAKTWLLREMELVNSEIYLLVGGYAAEFFFPKQEFSALVFQTNEINGKPAFVLPHPSPLNMKWLKDHPDFLAKRMIEIRREIHRALAR